MAITTIRPVATEEDLLRTPSDGQKYELVDGQRRTAAVHRSLTEVTSLGPNDPLDGEDVLPGFRCRLADVID